MNKGKKVLFLFGPTAVGKTQLLFDFFTDGFEVVNADSVQVYRGLDIGSAKADSQTLKAIKHHLVNILDPWESFNVATFIRLADKACEEIWAKDSIPVISGGTAFYFKHFLYGLSDAPQVDPEIRSTVELYIRDQGLVKAHQYLELVDPVSAARINVNDGYRISRALEVFRQTGRPLSSFALPTEPRNGMNVLSIGLCRDKESLKERIRQRVDIMFKEGIVAEIESLLRVGANPTWQSMQGIGYHEFMSRIWTGDKEGSIDALRNLKQADLEEIADKITMNSIHYAKRQMTFFKSFSDVTWVDPEDTSALKTIVKAFVES